VAKKELLHFEGLVTDILPNARYRIELDDGYALVVPAAGRMRKLGSRLAGDRLTVEVSLYDLEKRRLSCATRTNQPPAHRNATISLEVTSHVSRTSQRQ
jgi:translation initiation factor IF-1